MSRKLTDKQELLRWERFKKNIAASTPAEDLTHAEIEKKRVYLEARPIEWILYFFPKAAKYPFTPFHKKAINLICKIPELYIVLSWSRELAKSTIAMFVILFLILTGKKRNVLLFSATTKAAERLLRPYRAHIEANARLRMFYGDQVTPGTWTSTEFTLKNGASFLAVGAGEAPRGSKNDDIRPDVIYGDDFDTDEDCRNPEVLNKKWEWFEHAVYPTRSTSEPTLILFCGNIIAKDCCITRAGAMADMWDVVNIRDKNGKSTWPDKNTEEAIDRTLSKISKRAQQAEYYNNPVGEGKIFKEIVYGKIPPLSKFKFLILYGDPAPGESKKKSASFKSVCLLGKLKGKLYVIKPYLARGLNVTFIQWYIEALKYVDGKVPVFCYMENNKLQDPFFRQVFKPLVAKARKEQEIDLYIRPDEERKTDKATRIEADLEPLNSNGDLIFNEDEKGNPHMEEMETQFILFDMGLPYPADGPDCIQGGKRIIDNKQASSDPTVVISAKSFRAKNKHRM